MKFAIIAAGDGSRLVQEGVALPKPLVELDGRPMIKRLIDIFIECGAEEISVIVNEYMTQVQEYLRSLDLPVPLRLTVKTTPSSMHSFYEVSRGWTEGKFVLTTVDTIFHESDFKLYVDEFRESHTDGCMGVTDYIDDEKPLYVGVNDKMHITGYYDHPEPGCRFISAGIYGLNGKALTVLRECIDQGISRMRNFQRALVSEGLDLIACPIGKVIDVDHAEDIEKAKSLIEKH